MYSNPRGNLGGGEPLSVEYVCILELTMSKETHSRRPLKVAETGQDRVGSPLMRL